MAVVVVGLTQASSVIPVVSCSEAAFGTVTTAFVPLNDSASPYLPVVTHVAPVIVPLLPLPDASVDVVVNFQVIEHLWDQAQFVAECARVLRRSGLLMVSTPNRITFSPGRDTPINPFHTRELNAHELTELLVDGGFGQVSISGLFHGPRLREMDARHGGSIIDAQIARAVADAPWSAELAADVAAVTADDFDIVDRGHRDIDDSLDLIAIAVRQ